MEIKSTKAEEVIVIHMIGKIDFESIKTFRLLCANELVGKRVLFDFEKLSFVGSSGITYLIESIENLHKAKESVLGFCSLRSEFHRIFELGMLKDVPIYQDAKTGAILLQRHEKVVSTEVNTESSANPTAEVI